MTHAHVYGGHYSATGPILAAPRRGVPGEVPENVATCENRSSFVVSATRVRASNATNRATSRASGSGPATVAEPSHRGCIGTDTVAGLTVSAGQST
ncbi:Uncharacterised protein [Mycobacteroides abscessus]|nr:Uncharacterised protein [Mycobacteroides abscessus]CPU70428.1 Uncharacterised protein [Mycobacteroides abscessus]